ncbi:LINE-1 type transposase domain-containing protein 1 ES cell-associated protein 11 [Collichthys lucidus]|uniref:LINE-1 type transposase domain-containing protein 1 ES cell-associated protein 11 n=1 Tax=Collichthys lucidus TaxID=240159 RepID=A0A4U5VGH1_COLLU|nr:LINE-1 type transposase domain-containing protein 1 ES cell-associated protein 11 [Collichthys lucidus]
MKSAIEYLTASVAKLEDKCEDLESRSRRNNVRIIGVPEGPDTCSTTAVAAMLKEAFALEKEPLLDRSHRTLQPKPKPGERPRAIVCRFHYHSDCVDILRRARELREIKVQGLTISVFPDHTAKIARARAAFDNDATMSGGNFVALTVFGMGCFTRRGFASRIMEWRRTLFQRRKPESEL